MRVRPSLVVSLFLVLAFCCTLFAQTESATLSGYVTDPTGAALVGAEVQVVNVETGSSQTGRTNNVGLYLFPNLQPGQYRISVKIKGFKEFVKQGIVLHVQDALSQNFKMEVGSASESITVTGGASMVNTESAAVGTVVDRQFVENQPMNGRSFQSLLTLVPGVVAVPGASLGNKGEFSVNGQRTEENYYTVDGVSANSGSPASGTANATAVNFGASGSVPGVSALGTTQSLVSLDALQEFRIQTSTYSAEYGRTPGGQIAFVTRSGTDSWHGSGFDYFRNGALDANSWFNNKSGLAKTGERQNDFGGTLGGPIIIPHLYDGHNRTFFFFSYEGLRVVTPIPAVSAFVPDAATRASAAPALAPYMAGFPIANGPENGTTGTAQFVSAYSSPGSIDTSSVRIDHRVRNNFTIFGRYSDSPSQTMSRGVRLSNPIVTFSEVKTLTAGATNVFSSHLVNELRSNYTWNSGASNQTVDNLGGAVPLGLKDIKDSTGQPTPIVDSFFFTLAFGGTPSYVIQNLQQQQGQYNIVDSVSYSLGRHSLKFGVDYRHIITPLTLPHAAESVAYATLAQVKTNTPTLIAISSYPGTPIAPIYKNFSLFVQDEWKATRRLTVSLGLRWDVNPAPTDAHGHLPPTIDQIANLTTSKLNPQGTPFWNTTYGNFAPRMGVAYQLRQAPGWETVVRGGFGLFYDTGNQYASFPYNGIGIQSSGSIPTGSPAPATTAQLTALTAPSLATPYSGSVYAYDPALTLPYTLEWNSAIQQGLGNSQTLTVSYVGAAARNMLYQYMLTPNKFGNTNFSATGSNQLTVIRNGPTSDYDALQVQFQRRMSHGLQAMASYTWSHAIDEASTNNTTSQLVRGNSAFDVRHNFQAALTYEVPGNYATNPFAAAILRHWALDTRITGRSSLPIDITAGSFIDTVTGLSNTLRGDVVPGKPFYLYGAQCAAAVPAGNGTACPAGDRAINFNAFSVPTAAAQAAHQYGDSPRNFLRGYDAWQADLAVRREFPIHENVKLQFRAEAFNITNHPIFGAVQTLLTTGALAFGQATGTLNNQLGGLNSLYQQGGPRSLQLSLKLSF